MLQLYNVIYTRGSIWKRTPAGIYQLAHPPSGPSDGCSIPAGCRDVRHPPRPTSSSGAGDRTGQSWATYVSKVGLAKLVSPNRPNTNDGR